MKKFLSVLRRFVPPYKKYLIASVVFNILSVILNVFSFAALIPILQIIFKTGDAETATQLKLPNGFPSFQEGWNKGGREERRLICRKRRTVGEK